MLLIDTIYVNNSGGKILLDFLVQTLEERKIDVFYLFDERIDNDYRFIPLQRKIFIKPSLILRTLFYLKNTSRFSTVFCFGNVPPPIKLKANVYTYLHQKLFIELPDDIGSKQKIIFNIKSSIVFFLSQNTNYWMVQTGAMKNGLSLKKRNKQSKILVVPFFKSLNLRSIVVNKKANSFLYITNASPHKNNIRLLDAFKNFYDENKLGSLTLTINLHTNDFLIKKINELIVLGYPINNIGQVSREELRKMCIESEFLIYPSLSESFGLGIIEAIESGCKVLGADLDYMHDVCNPSYAFDPFSVSSISNAFYIATHSTLPQSELKVKNQINEIIDLLSD